MSDLDILRAPIVDELAQAVTVFDAELDSRHPFIRELCARVSQYRGKMLRPTLLLLTGRACNHLHRDHVVLAAVIEMAHIATLVHDDVLDEADVRRQAATIHRLTHNEAAVLLGDFLISHAYHLCAGLPTPRAARRIAAATNRVCEGELLQVRARGDWELSETAYLDIIRGKTAELTRAACELGAEHAGATEAVVAGMAAYGEAVGMAFQIVDDLLDLTADESQLGKSVGRDAAMGKPTLPVIRALSRCGAGAKRELLELLGASASDDGARRRLLERLAESGGIESARRTAEEFAALAAARLEVLQGSTARAALEAAAQFTLRRGV